MSQLGSGAQEEVVRVAERLGLDRGQVQAVVPLSERHRHCLWRIVTARKNYVLKWFPVGDAGAMEVEAYALLRELGIPTLPLYAAVEDALLLEDLDASPDWRLATAEDVACAVVGRAVARWYRVFHRRGGDLLACPDSPPGFLTREIDRLDPDSIATAGRRLGVDGQRGWQLAMEHVEALKGTMRALPETLNYNDFYWTNLALSRAPDLEPQAIVFDYHLLGIGVRFSDCRNVVGSLGGEAVDAFRVEYGPEDEREEILDRPLATLVALVTAAHMPRFPRWAAPSLEHVLRGDLERDLRAAIELAAQL